MATATLTSRTFRTASPIAGGTSTAAATALSILGGVVAIGIAAVGLLVVPVAALVVFGPALLAAF